MPIPGSGVSFPRCDTPRLPGSPLDIAHQADDGPADCYRIPALERMPDGDLLAVFDGRPGMADLPGNIAVLARRSTDGGRTWGTFEVIRSGRAPLGYGDPSLLVDRETGRVWVFYVAAVYASFSKGRTGRNPYDPYVTHPDVSYSDDSGRTWTHRRLTEHVREPHWAGMFAASGSGIQLRQGPYRGRLLQTYTVRVDGRNFAMVAYSDDHGDSWQHSELIGPGADENKVVELSDGTVLLNSRATPCRLISRSTDGGLTWSPFRPDEQLPDPGNNGALLRAFPDAPPDSDRARVVLFVNTEDTEARHTLVVKVSLDDAATWTGRALVTPGPAAYATLAEIGPGRYGLLYERDGYQAISFLAFDSDDLGVLRSPVSAAQVTTQAGHSTAVPVVFDPLDEAVTLRSLPLQGWEGEAVTVPAGGAGATVRVTPPVGCLGEFPIRLVISDGERIATATTLVTVQPSGPAVLDIAVDPVLDTVAPDATGIGLGHWWVIVRNTGNIDAVVTVAIADRPDDHVELRLPAGAIGTARGQSLSAPISTADVRFVVDARSPDGQAIRRAVHAEVRTSTVAYAAPRIGS